MAGLTTTGFVRKRLEDIKADLENGLRDQFGNDIAVDPDSVYGQLIAPFAQAAADLWELAEDTYLSQYPETAEGVSLEQACQLVGVNRLGQQRSTAVISATGSVGTVVPAGTIVSSSTDQFSTLEAATIAYNNIDRLAVAVSLPVAGQTYTVIIDSVPVTITAGTSDAASIAAQLMAAVNAEPVAASAVSDGPVLTLLAKGVAFTGSVTSSNSGLTISEVASPIKVQALAAGPAPVNAGNIRNVVTAVAGLDRIVNRLDGVVGRIIETDTELRLRRRRGLRRTGSGSPESIRATLIQDVPNVLSCEVYENVTDSVDAFGRPPHTLEVVIEGADDVDIARAVWKLKPAGIGTFGNTSRVVTDVAGNPQTVYWSRPAPLYIWVKVTILDYNNEEAFPETGLQQIADSVVAAGNRLGAGIDVIRQRLFAAVFNVPGLSDVKIELGSSTTPDGAHPFAESNVAVSASQRARFDVARVEVAP